MQNVHKYTQQLYAKSCNLYSFVQICLAGKIDSIWILLIN